MNECTLHIGLIAGRHDMPVTAFLLPENITNLVGYHESLYNAAQSAARHYPLAGRKHVVLYVTGLTNAALGATSGFKSRGVSLTIASYDNKSASYMFFEFVASDLHLCENCWTKPVEGEASLKQYCPECAQALHCACSACLCDAGNSASGYSNCCNASII